jgi:hypothetical protein
MLNIVKNILNEKNIVKTDEEIQTEINKYDLETEKMSIQTNTFIWDKVSPINGVHASLFLQREDVQQADHIYILEIEGRVLFQTSAPYVDGITLLTESNVNEIMNNHLDTEVTNIATQKIIEKVVNTLSA